MAIWARWKQRARELKRETAALIIAVRRPDVPWYTKLLAALVVAYALSPIDLIPDFIPVLGYLDDLVLLPLGILLLRRLIPPAILEECRAQALREEGLQRRSWTAALIILLLWVCVGVLLLRVAAPPARVTARPSSRGDRVTHPATTAHAPVSLGESLHSE